MHARAISLDTELLRLPRFSSGQLDALAKAVRNRAASDDRTADSVAAALESVSRRRATRTGVLANHAGFSLLERLLRQSAAICNRLCSVLVSTVVPRARIARPQFPGSLAGSVRSPSARRATVDPSRKLLQAALNAVQVGGGISPDVCDALLVREWVEWVDRESGASIDENDPRSALRMTAKGKLQMSLASLVECAI